MLDLESRSPAKPAAEPGQSHLRTAILVLGMHRSGTSALAGVFGMLGADFPKTLIGANRSNERGHWESEAIARLNDRILESAGTTWDDWSEFNPRWLRSPKVNQFRDEARRLIADEFGRSGFLVLKDPRICRFPAFWIDILATSGLRPVVVLPIRNPLEVAASLEKRNHFDPAFAQLMWLRHVLDAEAGTRSLPRLFVKFEDLLTGWSGMAQKAELALDLAWPRMGERAATEIEDFLSNRLKHHSERRDRVLENTLLSRWLRTTFDIAWRWAEAGENEADVATLEEVRSEFNEAAPAFAGLVTLGRRRAAQVSELQGELADVQAQCQVHAEEAKSLRKDLEDREKALSEMQDRVALELKDVQMSLQSMEGTVEEIAEQSGAYSEAVTQLAQTKSALERWRAEGQRETEKLVKGYREHVDYLLRESRRQDAAEAKLQRQLGAAEARVKKLEDELRQREAAEERSRRLEGEVRSLTDQLRSTRAAASRELGRAVANLIGVSRLPVLSSLQMRRMKKKVRRAGIFDDAWYLDRYKDVAEAKADALEHYIAFGAAEGREPNSAFAASDAPKAGRTRADAPRAGA